MEATCRVVPRQGTGSGYSVAGRFSNYCPVLRSPLGACCRRAACACTRKSVIRRYARSNDSISRIRRCLYIHAPTNKTAYKNAYLHFALIIMESCRDESINIGPAKNSLTLRTKMRLLLRVTYCHFSLDKISIRLLRLPGVCVNRICCRRIHLHLRRVPVCIYFSPALGCVALSRLAG